MHLGLPPDLTWYKLLTDLGSLIGGILALVAGAALYCTGHKQAEAANKQARISDAALKLAQDEFRATHRPLLIVRNINPRVLNADQQIVIRFTIINKGQAGAGKVEWRMGVAILDAGKNIFGTEGIETIHQTLGASLANGQSHLDDFVSPAYLAGPNLETVKTGASQLWFCGVIAYFDDVGIVRRTGFARRYDPATHRFHFSDDSDNEFTD